MESHTKLMGHPVHPMLVVFPLGLLPVAFIFDLVCLVTGQQRWADTSFWMISAGILGGVIAAIFGAIDFLAIPPGTRAKQIGLLHGAGNVLVMILFIGSWLIRYQSTTTLPGAAVFCGFLGVLLAIVTAWLGGELVDRLGVGVDDHANLNAPSSIATPTEAAGSYGAA